MLKIKELKYLNHSINNFEIDKPGLYGFVGQNGSGKSTLFSILNGETKVEDSIIISEKIMYISSLECFDKYLKGSDYLKLLSANEYDSALNIIKIFNAESFINKKIGKYSLGMLQQFAIILSLSVTSNIIIFDEIYSGLDIKHQTQFFDILSKEKETKVIIFTSHFLTDVENNCDKVFYLGKGIEEVFDFSKLRSDMFGGSNEIL